MKAFLWIIAFSSFTLYGQQSAGNSLFNDAVVHQLNITFSESNFWELLTNDYDDFLQTGSTTYRHASIEFDGDLISNVGVRQRGQYSNFGFPGLKKPLKIDVDRFVNDQHLDGIDKFNLANFALDPSFIRDKVAYDFHHLIGNIAPRASYAQVYINNQYWGLYLLVEQIESSFLSRNFNSKKGSLFKAQDDTDLDWRGFDSTLYPEIKLKSGEESWHHLLTLIDAFNNRTSDFLFSEKLESLIDLDRYFNILTLDVFINNWDSYYDNGRNFYLYHDPNSMLFQWIPWDYNLSFSNSYASILPQDGSKDNFKPLIKAIIENKCLKTKYLETFCSLIQHTLTKENTDQIIDKNVQLIKNLIANDPNKFYSTNLFNTNINDAVFVEKIYNGDTSLVRIPGIKTLVTERINQVSKELWQQNIDCTLPNSCETCFSFRLFPNPANNLLTIEYTTQGTNKELILEVIDTYGRITKRSTLSPMQSNIEIRTDDYPSGIYWVRITTTDGLFRRQKLVIAHG